MYSRKGANIKAILVFISTAYASAIGLGLLIGTTGGRDSAFLKLAFLSMFLPAVAVLVVSLTVHEGLRVQWESFPLKYLPFGLFLIPGVLHAVMVPCMAVLNHGLHWQDWLTPHQDGLYYTPVSRDWGILTGWGLIGRITLNAAMGLVFVSFMAFFEEIGWRGWLLPRLTDYIGPRRAVVVTAIVWGVWHLPFEFSGIVQINGLSPAKLALVHPLGVMIASLIIGWLWLRTESIWIVTLAHGALNNWGQYAFKYMKDSAVPATDVKVLGAGFLALLIVGVFLLSCDITSRPDISGRFCRVETSSVVPERPE